MDWSSFVAVDMFVNHSLDKQVCTSIFFLSGLSTKPVRRCMVHQSIHREGFSSTHSQRDRFRQSEKRHAFHFRHRIFPKQQHAVWRKSRKQHPHSCTALQSLIIRIVNTLKGWVSYKLTSTPYLLTLFPTLFPLFIVTHSTFYTS